MHMKTRSNTYSITKRNVAFWLFFLLLIPGNLQAQFRRAALLKPAFILAYEKIPSSHFSDTTGKFGVDEVAVSFKLPLYTRMTKAHAAGSFGFWGIVLKAGGSYTWPHFSYFRAGRQLVNMHAGINGIYYGGSKTMYLLNLNTLVGEDNYSINHPLLRYTGSVMMMHKVSNTFNYLIGAAYSFVYGNGLPMPLLGGGFKLGKKSRVNFILPLSVSYSYRFDQRNRFLVFFKPDGGVSNIASRELFPGSPDIIQLKQRVFIMGAAADVAIRNAIKICPEAGICSKRTITMAEPGSSRNEYLFKEQTKAGFYIKLTLRMRFGVKEYHGENDAVNYLMDNGMDDLEMAGDDKLIVQ